MKIKIKKIFCLLCLYFLAFPCVQAQDINEFFFEEPQPRKQDALAYFPKNMRGLYKSDRDSTRRLRITADSVIFEVPLLQYALASELRSKNYTLQDSVVITRTGKTLPCMVRNDTVFFVDFVQSVYFARSSKHVIKMLDETLVLSRQVAENRWDCTLLSTVNGKMCLAYFDFYEKTADIRSNKKIDEVKNATPPHYIASFKKKDFLKLMAKNYFPEKHYFYKRFDWQ